MRKNKTRRSPKDEVLKFRRGNHILMRAKLLNEGERILQLDQIKMFCLRVVRYGGLIQVYLIKCQRRADQLGPLHWETS